MSEDDCDAPPVVIAALDAFEMSECMEFLAGWLKTAERQGLLEDLPTNPVYDLVQLLSDLARYSAILVGGQS